MMADFLLVLIEAEDDPDDRKTLEELVTVIEFDTEAEREQFIQEQFEPSDFPNAKVLRPRQAKK